MEEIDGDGSTLLKLPLGEAASTFDLEKAVCSHGLFMMPPNRWDPISRSLFRPLRLLNRSVTVRISQPNHLHPPRYLHVRVYGTWSFSTQDQRLLLDQVERMLRLSDSEERKVKEFLKIVDALGEEAEWLTSFGGRVFRSPSLFEDMVKCILLCNCQWPRTLAMAESLCDLQLELHQQSSSFEAPKTPARKELKRKHTSVLQIQVEDPLCEDPECLSIRDTDVDSSACEMFGNFPSPEELANLDENFLAKRCNLGYRSGRVLKLAQAIVEGEIKLTQLEDLCKEASVCSYSMLAEQLSHIYGFGPFTCANVLMCLGFYHVIPSDSETIRHLKQVHRKRSSIQTVQRDVESIYGKYAPFQFLAYWAEVWNFYEQRFGKLSELPITDYKLLTASNMKMKARHKTKKL